MRIAIQKFKISSAFLPVFLLICNGLFSQNITISGYVTDKQTGERLIGANVYNVSMLKGNTTNNYGFYSITFPQGNVKLVCSFVGFKQYDIELSVKENRVLNIELQSNSNEVDEIVVKSSSKNKVEQAQMSMVALPIQKIHKVPVILGEADIMKIIQLYPGVQTGTEGTSGINVRGGSSDQNLFLIDGVPVYNVNHLFGFFSTFDPSAIKSVNVYTGGFPARYGGRLSSVVDIRMTEGNLKELKGDFTIGLISSKLMLEGPIAKDKTSFMISVRRTYADLLAKPIFAYLKKDSDSKTDYALYFYDINGKLSHQFSEKSKLYLSIYNGKDQFSQNEEYDNSTAKIEATTVNNNQYGIGWSNTISALRWNYLLSNKLFSNTSLSYSKFIFDVNFLMETSYLKNDTTITDYYKYYSGVEDFAFKVDFDYFPSQNHSVKFGVGTTRHRFDPGVSLTEDVDNRNIKEGTFANEFSAYAEDEFSIAEKVNVNLGIHLSLFSVENKNYFRPQPRISLNFKPFENVSFKASYSRMAQHIHLLNSAGIELPMDLWVPITARYEPPISDQLAIGTAINIPKNFNLTIEGFYKNMKNLLEYQEGATFTGGGVSWENIVEKGIGWSYGVEFLLEKTIGKTTGWLGYTWSKTERQFENINFGKVFPYKYDRRHNISVVLTHKINDRIDVSGTWVFNTGAAATVAFTKYPVTEIPNFNGGSGIYYVYNYNGRNGYRLPNYHRLDLGVNFKKKKKHGTRTWTVSLYNTYNQDNPFMLTKRTDYSTHFLDENGTAIHPEKLYFLSLFPIIPSISYSYKF